jgi:hypothetical protein
VYADSLNLSRMDDRVDTAGKEAYNPQNRLHSLVCVCGKFVLFLSTQMAIAHHGTLTESLRRGPPLRPFRVPRYTRPPGS